MASTAQEEMAVYSTLGADPDLGDLVEMYVDEMPDRIAALKGAFQRGEMEDLRREAHQMKGAGGSYGFDQLTPVAAALECAVSHHESVETIEQTLEKLLDVCLRVRAGSPR